jgi:hypothetical protein
VIYPAASEHRNATSDATSLGSPTLPRGVRSNTDLFDEAHNISHHDMVASVATGFNDSVSRTREHK